MLEGDNTSEYCHVLRLIFSEYDAYKVFQVNYITVTLLDFQTEKRSRYKFVLQDRGTCLFTCSSIFVKFI